MSSQATLLDRAGDIKQNETTPWLEHTGWPRLFRNRPLDIIAASARQPGPAWNEGYLLGHWRGAQLLCPATVEAQLRVILRGVDLMFSRAEFTLAQTSYRTKCWLNTYWKDEFWPHEFKIVSSLKRYITIWKRFICFIFRVLRFAPKQRRRIFNLAFKPDEVKMMRHILSLVADVQQEADYSEDESSESDGGVAGDTSDEDDEGQFEEEEEDEEDEDEYEDEDEDEEEEEEEEQEGDIEIVFDEDDDYDSVDEDSNGSSSSFSLPSGTWLQLSEALFQLSMMFWTYQDPTGDMSSSVLIYYTAVMGIQRNSLAYYSPHHSSPRLAALMWVGRLLFLEYALPVHSYATLAFPWPCRMDYPSQTERMDSIRRKYLLRGCYTPFGEIIELKAFAKSIVKREGIPGNLCWAPDGHSFTIGDNKVIRLTDFCETYHKVLAQVQQQVDEMMLGWDPIIDLSAIRDDLTYRKAGWSFLQKPENNLVDVWKTLLYKLQLSSFRGKPFAKAGHWDVETCNAYLNAGLELSQSAFSACHLTASLPGRGSEVTSIRYLNSELTMRNVFFYDNRMIIVIRYNKARASNHYAFYIVRYLPSGLSLSLLKYLAIVRPVWEFLSKQMHITRHQGNGFLFLDPTGRRKHLTSSQASGILKNLTRTLATPWTLSLYRQAALAIAKRYLVKLVERTNFYYPPDASNPIRMFAAGAGHHPRMLLTTYAIDRALPERLQPELLEMYRRLSDIWQEWNRSYYHEYCLEPKQRQRKQHGPNAYDGNAYKRAAESDGGGRAPKRHKINWDDFGDDGSDARSICADGFLYNAQHRILICIACQSMIQPGHRHIYRHLNRVHRITGEACKALIDRFNSYSLCPFQELTIPCQKVPRVSGLPVYKAFKCNVCLETLGKTHFTVSSNKIRDHVSTHKLGVTPMMAEQLGKFEPCYVQTFSSAKGRIRYFEIELME